MDWDSVAEEFTRLCHSSHELPNFLFYYETRFSGVGVHGIVYLPVRRIKLASSLSLASVLAITRHCPCMWSPVWESILASFWKKKKKKVTVIPISLSLTFSLFCYLAEQGLFSHLSFVHSGYLDVSEMSKYPKCVFEYKRYGLKS